MERWIARSPTCSNDGCAASASPASRGASCESGKLAGFRRRRHVATRRAGHARRRQRVPHRVDDQELHGAALMTLVADGRLRLDDPVSVHVPELAPWSGPTSDGPPITVRHLVSMEAGLPTDDAWADRHLDLSPGAMDALIDAGAVFAWTPGTRFEYSNLGWGLVGRVIERVAGERVQDLVARVAARAARHDVDDVGAARRPPSWPSPTACRTVRGRTKGNRSATARSPRWAACGRPYATSRAGSASSSTRGRRATRPDDGPLPRWARREMQQLRRVDEVTQYRPSPRGSSRVSATGYGIGLGVRIDERLGTSVGHSGGLPGYGSHMRWLPEHGVGVIGLSNVTYGSMHGACIEALEVLADRNELGPRREVEARDRLAEACDARRRPARRRGATPRPDALFADNVGSDESYERRADQRGAWWRARGSWLWSRSRPRPLCVAPSPPRAATPASRSD